MTGWRWARVVGATSARRMIADRGGFAVAVGFYVVVIAVLSGLWRAAAEAGGGAVAGYTAVALTWYVATSEAATVALNIRLIEDVGTDIASGDIATELLRPVTPLGVRLAAEVGRCLPKLGLLWSAGIAFSLIVTGPPPQPLTLLLAAPSLVLAVVVNLAAQHAFAGLAFWVRDAKSAWFLYQKLVFILGGMLLPLQVLPDWLERTALVLPFMAMSYAPARLASGHFEPWLLAVQTGWAVVLTAVAATVFAAGARRLQVVGG